MSFIRRTWLPLLIVGGLLFLLARDKVLNRIRFEAKGPSTPARRLALDMTPEQAIALMGGPDSRETIAWKEEPQGCLRLIWQFDPTDVPRASTGAIFQKGRLILAWADLAYDHDQLIYRADTSAYFVLDRQHPVWSRVNLD